MSRDYEEASSVLSRAVRVWVWIGSEILSQRGKGEGHARITVWISRKVVNSSKIGRFQWLNVSVKENA